MEKPQRGKQTSRVPLPAFFRFIDLVYRLQATWSDFRTRVRAAIDTIRATARSFISMVRLLTNYEDRQLRRSERAEEHRRELKAIGRRLLRSN